MSHYESLVYMYEIFQIIPPLSLLFYCTAQSDSSNLAFYIFPISCTCWSKSHMSPTQILVFSRFLNVFLYWSHGALISQVRSLLGSRWYKQKVNWYLNPDLSIFMWLFFFLSYFPIFFSMGQIACPPRQSLDWMIKSGSRQTDKSINDRVDWGILMIIMKGVVRLIYSLFLLTSI